MENVTKAAPGWTINLSNTRDFTGKNVCEARERSV